MSNQPLRNDLPIKTSGPCFTSLCSMINLLFEHGDNILAFSMCNYEEHET